MSTRQRKILTILSVTISCLMLMYIFYIYLILFTNFFTNLGYISNFVNGLFSSAIFLNGCIILWLLASLLYFVWNKNSFNMMLTLKDRIMQILITIISSVSLLGALTITGAFKFYQGSFYSFTLPFIVNCIVALAFGIIALIKPTRLFGFIATFFNGLLFATFLYAYAKWPGGDDGPGLAWSLVIGLFSEIALTLSSISLLLYSIRHKL